MYWSGKEINRFKKHLGLYNIQVRLNSHARRLYKLYPIKLENIFLGYAKSSIDLSLTLVKQII